MRASVAAQFSLDRFGAWRVAVWTLASFGVLGLVAWVAVQRGAAQAWMMVLAGLVSLCAVALALNLTRMRACSLRWDASCWHLGPVELAGNEPESGELTVAIDLGGWMLLRFERFSNRRRRPVTWLPVQRRGMEASWHALRCAVYSPRPAPEVDGTETPGAQP